MLASMYIAGCISFSYVYYSVRWKNFTLLCIYIICMVVLYLVNLKSYFDCVLAYVIYYSGCGGVDEDGVAYAVRIARFLHRLDLRQYFYGILFLLQYISALLRV